MVALTADRVVVELESRLDRAKADTTAYATNFERSMEKVKVSGAAAENTVAKAGAGMGRGLGVGTAAAGVAVLAFVALAAAVNETKKAMDFADEIADTASKLHIGTETLQEYRYALQKAGGDEKDFAAGLNALSEKLGQAKAGMREALRPFQQLGFTPAQIESLNSGEEALTAIADKIAGLGSSAEQDAIIKMLGVEKLAPLILKGTEEMGRLRAEAQKIGVVMDESLVKKAADAKDDFEAMHKVVDVQLKSALADLAPIIVGLTGLIAKMAVAAGDVVDKFRSIENRRRGALERQIEDAQAWNARMIEMAGGLGRLSPSQRTVYSNNQLLIDRLSSELGRRAQDDTDNQRIALARLGITSGGGLSAAGKSGAGGGASPKGTKTDPIVVTLPDPESAAAFAERQQNREALVDWQRRIERSKYEEVDGVDGRGVNPVADLLNSPEFKAQVEAALDLQDKFREEVRDGILGGLEAAANGDGVEYLASLLRRRLFEAVADAIANGLTNAKGSGGLGGALATVGSFLFGRAAGGNVVAGQAYYVHRDEVFTPAQSGRMVTPGQRAIAAGGGSGLIYAPQFDLRGALVTEDILEQINAMGVQAAAAGAKGGAALSHAQLARRSRQVLR